MKRTVVLACALAIGLGTTACQENPTELGQPAEASLLQNAQQSLIVADELTIRSAVAGPGSERMTDRAFCDELSRAINPDDYECQPTDLGAFLQADFNLMVAENINALAILYYLWTDQVPTYDALLFQTGATPQYYGYNGEYTDPILRTEKSIKRFWDIYSADIRTLAMHGTMLLDTARVRAVYEVIPSFITGAPAPLNTLTPRQASLQVRNAMLSLPQSAPGGNNSFFTFNAFAYSGSLSPDKIVMGDGVLAAYQSMGFGDVAPQAIYAHEFAHHIQFEKGYFNDPIVAGLTTPEKTRYSEMMADAMAAYFLTHKRGAAMNAKRVEQFLTVFFQTGDCSFTSSGHHGTPNQRLKAAQFGFQIAAEEMVKGTMLTAEQFHALFVQAYPTMIQSDVTP